MNFFEQFFLFQPPMLQFILWGASLVVLTFFWKFFAQRATTLYTMTPARYRDQSFRELPELTDIPDLPKRFRWFYFLLVVLYLIGVFVFAWLLYRALVYFDGQFYIPTVGDVGLFHRGDLLFAAVLPGGFFGLFVAVIPFLFVDLRMRYRYFLLYLQQHPQETRDLSHDELRSVLRLDEARYTKNIFLGLIIGWFLLGPIIIAVQDTYVKVTPEALVHNRFVSFGEDAYAWNDVRAFRVHLVRQGATEDKKQYLIPWFSFLTHDGHEIDLRWIRVHQTEGMEKFQKVLAIVKARGVSIQAEGVKEEDRGIFENMDRVWHDDLSAVYLDLGIEHFRTLFDSVFGSLSK